MKSVGFNAQSKDNKELVKRAIAWLDTQPDSNNFIHNLKIIVKNEYVNTKNLGFLASLIPTYYKAVEYEERNRDRIEKTDKDRKYSKFRQNIAIVSGIHYSSWIRAS